MVHCGNNLRVLELSLYSLMIMALPFEILPRSIVTQVFGIALWKYFFVLGVICTLYKKIRHKDDFHVPSSYIAYIGAFFCWYALCTVIGVFNFPFYEIKEMGISSKLSSILQTLEEHHVYVNQLLALKLWLVLRFIKSVLLETIFTFGVALWVLSLYSIDWKEGFRVTRNALLILAVFLSGYSLIEIAFLAGNNSAREILTVINPLYMDIKYSQGWWPPLLWENQLRSLFPEPSHFGIAASAIIPFLMSYLLEGKKRYYCIFTFFVILLFFTKSRMALWLYIGEICLFIIVAFFKDLTYRKTIINVILLSFISFLLVSNFTKLLNAYNSPNSINNPNNDSVGIYLSESAESYLSKNVTSVVGNSRSNNARIANVRAKIMTGIHHPIFGVGYGLESPYLEQEMRDQDLAVNEVRLWIRTMNSEGVLKSGFPALTRYGLVFAQSGFIGLMLYLAPFFYVFYRMTKVKKIFTYDVICIFIAFLGSLASFLASGGLFIAYLFLGLLLCYENNDLLRLND